MARWLWIPFGVAALALFAYCGRGAEARASPWIFLAQGFVPEPAPLGPWRPSADGRGPLTLAASGAEHAAVAELVLRRADWNATQRPGVWWTPLPLISEGGPHEGAPEELVVGGRALPVIPEERLQDPPAEGCAVVGERLYLAWSAEDAPPEEALLRQWCARGRERDGRWRVAVGRWSGEGFPVWPGERVELALALPPRSALSFDFAARTVGLAAGSEELVLRVELDDVVLWQGAWRGPTPLHARVELPPGGVRRARLAFEVEGPAALGAVLAPVVGPAQRDTSDERRPDLMMFVADTFRADNLAAYGSTRGLTPELDAFAAESVLFERAWAPSSWTLPSHATLMTGLFPHQHGATAADHALPASLVTLAEHLQAAGYRTGATTDEGFVTRAAGMDAGFEWFDQHWGSLDDTLASARHFLDADDGRPVFLFVQSYHTHAPYLPSAAAQTELAGRLSLGGDFDALERVLVPDPALRTEGGTLSAERARSLEHYRDLYLGTVADLDRAFGQLRRDLEHRGLLEHGYLVFTSDHGEAFYEHGVLGHGAGVWEEVARIPLAIHGAGLEPRRVSLAAGLIDLPVTLCALAGLEPHADWLGSPLHELAEERPVFVFGCDSRGQPPTVGIVDGDAKLIVDEAALRGEAAVERWRRGVLAAYDLGRDPNERDDLAAHAPWVEDVLGRLVPPLPALFEPRAASAAAELDAAEREALERLGYVGH